MTKNIIIFVLLVLIGGLAIVSIEELKTLHAAQAYIEALENDFPDYAAAFDKPNLTKKLVK